MSLGILYPNGKAEAVANYIWDPNTLELVIWDGSLTVGSVVIGGVTIANGADVAEGNTADAKVVGDVAGTVSAKLRGINYLTDLINTILGTISSTLSTISTNISSILSALGGTLTVSVSNTFLGTKRAGITGTNWTSTHVPSSNTKATTTKAANASGKNVCTGFTVSIVGDSTAPAATSGLIVSLIDGDTGGTTYLWRSYISLPAVAGAMLAIVRTGLWIEGSTNTKMTLEFSAAGGANTLESVTMEGTTA